MKWSKLSPNNFYFHAVDSEDGVTVIVSPASYFDENSFMYDQRLEIESLLPDYLSEEMECVFLSTESLEKTVADLRSRKFSESKEFSEFCSLAFGATDDLIRTST